MDNYNYLERRFSTSYITTTSLSDAPKLAEDEMLNYVPDWDAVFIENELLLNEQVATLKAFTKCKDNFMVNELLVNNERNGQRFADAVCTVFKSITDTKVLLFGLKMTEDFILADVPARLKFFQSKDASFVEDILTSDDAVPTTSQGYIVAPFVKLVNHPSPKVQGKAVYLASLMLSRQPIPLGLVKAVVDHVVDVLEASVRGHEESEEAMSGTLLSLTVLLRHARIRQMFAQTKAVRHLFALLMAHMRNLAVLYNIVLSLWLCAFEPSVRKSIQSPELSALVSVLKIEPFEKIIRVTMSLLRLILSSELEKQKELSEALIGLGGLKLLDNLGSRKALKDEDLLEDIKWVNETLQENFRVLSTFERYEQELRTERLTWSSTVHTEQFWKENSLKLESNDFEALKKLILLLNSSDPTTAAIACFDIGQFVQYYPNGKMIVDQFGGKRATMELLQHENAEVQKQALKTCSKLMISNWSQLTI